nr:1,4-alpha-glucan-branching enzyme-like isoform X1 [Ciona intestinalis]|eukprot:XP_002126483.1 1,4-alpha-glucan-branching enzyme-like isoform X1 [Ciona intestinalis]
MSVTEIYQRYGMFEKTKMAIESVEGLERFTQGHKEFGIMMTDNGGVRCMEWVPDVKAVYLKGEFSNCWELRKFEARNFGKWELYIPPCYDGSCPIQHLSELKLVIETHDNQRLERISPWAKYVVQRGDDATFKWLFWNTPRNQIQKYTQRPSKPDRLRIYEAHIGIASDRYEVSSYRHFTRQVLPRIRDLGYNTLLLMALVEHPYYPSFGYQVTNYFAASSRYGTTAELKELIDTAHAMGIYVIMDIMHGESSKNILDGLNMFDGTEGGFFKQGKEGTNQEHNTRVFDYSKWETVRFLLSQLRFYLDEFQIDGFRFCGVTEMVYRDMETGRRMTDEYEQYFGTHMNLEAISYLMLMNDMLHKFYPEVTTIAEEMSGLPCITRLVSEGGLGFDYKMAMDIPEKWMKLISNTRDEDWCMEYIQNFLTNQRPGEKRIAYVENHEQNEASLMTLSRNLIGNSPMSETEQLTISLDRGLSLYKMIRLLTHAFTGQGYMNFIGNEFGHPDWVELPSPANNDSYKFARRQLYLADNDQLRYKYLKRYDTAINKLEQNFAWLKSNQSVVTRKHEDDKVFVFERAGLIFVFNFHPTKSYKNYKIPVQNGGSYNIVLDSDEKFFGGKNRNQQQTNFNTQNGYYENCNNSTMVDMPSRSAFVMSQCNNMPREEYQHIITSYHGEFWH